MKRNSNVVLVQGDDESVVIPVKDGDGGGWIEDLGTFDIKYTVTSDRGSGTEVLAYTDSDSEISVVTASSIDSQDLTNTGVPDSSDVIRVDIPGTDTSNLTDYPYYHECEIEDGNNIEQTVMQGRVDVQKSST